MNSNITLPDVTDTAAVKRFISSSATAYRKHLEGEGNVTDRAAYATHYGEHVLGVIFQSDRNANEFTNETWALRFGVNSKGAPTGWRTLGHVLVTLGLGHENETYVRLRNTNGYTNPDVKKACWADGANEESIKAAMDAREAEKKSRAARANDGTKKDDDDSEKDVPVMVRVLAALEVLDAGSKEITPDEWIDVEKALAKIIDRENRLRAQAAATPKKRTANKRTAKKAAAAA